MSDTEQKILGFVPKSKYVHFAYMFLLISAAGNVLYSLIAIIGIHLESAGYATMILGLASFTLAVLGLTMVKNEFTAHDHAHFKFLAILFPAFFVIFVIFGGVYAVSFFLGFLCTAAIGAAQCVLVWTGYNSWQDGRIVTAANIKDEIKKAIEKR
jgi:hypothetical protein